MGALNNPIGTASGQLRGAATDIAKQQAIQAIARFMSLPSREVSEAFDLGSLTISALRGGIIDLVRLWLVMLDAGVHAMTTEKRIERNLSAAHAFGYWIAQDRGVHRPVSPPPNRQSFHEAEDANGNYDHRTAEQWGEVWRQAHHATIRSLENGMDLTVARREIQDRAGSALNANQRPDATVEVMTRGFMLQEFNNDPAAAAAVFFASRIKDEAQIERRVSVLVYRNNPYVP